MINKLENLVAKKYVNSFNKMPLYFSKIITDNIVEDQINNYKEKWEIYLPLMINFIITNNIDQLEDLSLKFDHIPQEIITMSKKIVFDIFCY